MSVCTRLEGIVSKRATSRHRPAVPVVGEGEEPGYQRRSEQVRQLANIRHVGLSAAWPCR
jgi:hypothetical protein